MMRQQDEWIMSALEQDALKNVFAGWKSARMPASKDSDAFEVFAAEIILKDAELSDSEIEAGNCGGGNDVGVDGFFFFIDRTLVQSTTFTPNTNPQSATLNIIQATTSPNFTEDKIDKLERFFHFLLEWDDLTGKKNIKQAVKDNIMLFREKYKQILEFPHVFNIYLYYASTNEYPPSSGLLLRVEELRKYIVSKATDAIVTFVPLGCKHLLNKFRTSPNKKIPLQTIKEFSTTDKCVVCLCTVASYAAFLDDGKGQIRTWMMEPNVRDYQGNNKVNKQIRDTLNQATWGEDFWWLNNGVTILADGCPKTGDTLTIDNPEVVNGLQTSYEIFRARNNPELQKRHLLVKIILAPNDKSKTAIIKATNSQTTVKSISLKATEPLQFAIEEELMLAGLFYDRRKGKCRQQRRPIDKVVSMKAMAQAIIAAYLQFPSDARGRPESLVDDDKIGGQIFNENSELKFYLSCIQLDRRCNEFVRKAALSDDAKTDLHYYVTMIAACELCNQSQPTVETLALSQSRVDSALSAQVLTRCLNTAIKYYKKHGETDQAAKGREMENEVKAELSALFPRV